MALNLPSTLKSGATTASLIADILRQQILNGQLKSQDRLRQDEIAAQFGVSKIPVREALFQLQSEGLVNFTQSRGAEVSALSTHDVREICIMRIALETTALRYAHPNLKKADYLRANTTLQLIDHEDNPEKWGELNWEFHHTLYAAAQLGRLLDSIRILHVNMTRHFAAYHAMAYRDKSQAEHNAILKACKNNQIDHACQLLEAHLQSAASSLISFLKKS